MTKTINQTIEFKATPEAVYEIIMDEKQHSSFTSASATIGRKVGDKFSVWGGYATGKNLELVPNKKIVQTWRASDWPDGVESKVTFEFIAKNGGCELRFTQEGIPEDQYKDIKQGWIDNYWDLMKDYLSR